MKPTQTEESHQMFRNAYFSAKKKPENSKVMPYQEWVRYAFRDFYAKGNVDYLRDFYRRMDLSLGPIVRLYERSLNDPEKQKPFVDLLLTSIESMDSENIRQKEGKLRGFVDISLQLRVLSVFVDHLSDESLWPGMNSLALASIIVEHSPMSRPGIILLGREQLANGKYEAALKTAIRATSLECSCHSAQRLLYEARIKYYGLDETSWKEGFKLHNLKDRFCPKPFETLNITALPTDNEGGCYYICNCLPYLPYPVKKILGSYSIEEIWNSETALEIRRSILDGDFTYCSPTLCQWITGDLLPKKEEVSDPFMRSYIENHTTFLEEGPRLLMLSHDTMCNLSCPSCRTGRYEVKPDEEDMISFKNDIILPLLQRVNGRVMIAGMGDPIASKHYRSILNALSPGKYPNLKVILVTNGILLNEREWGKLERLHEMIEWILVSIDAAKPQTYEKVRYPARWSDLMENLHFISRLRRDNTLNFFGINFVVQKTNFREMVDFVELGLTLGVDLITFQGLLNSGAYDLDSFLENDVTSPFHPQHNELLNIMNHPLLRHHKVYKSDLVNIFMKARQRQEHSNRLTIWADHAGNVKKVWGGLKRMVGLMTGHHR